MPYAAMPNAHTEATTKIIGTNKLYISLKFLVNATIFEAKMNNPINKPNTYFKNVIIALFIVKDNIENIAVGKINTKTKIGSDKKAKRENDLRKMLLYTEEISKNTSKVIQPSEKNSTEDIMSRMKVIDHNDDYDDYNRDMEDEYEME